MKPMQQKIPFAPNRSKSTPPGALLFRTLFAILFSFWFATAPTTKAGTIIAESGTITPAVGTALVTNDVLTISGSANFVGVVALGQKNITFTSDGTEWATIQGPGLNPSGTGNQNRFTIGGSGTTTWKFDRIIITGGDSGSFGGGAVAATAGSVLTIINGDFKLIKNVSLMGNAANTGGGAMNAAAGSLQLTGNVEIAHNIVTATNTAITGGGGGGGINISNGNGSIILGTTTAPQTVYVHDNQSIGLPAASNNPTLGQGGGIRSYGFASFISDVIITSNTASGNGGGIYVAKAFTMENSTFIADNYSGFDGGALYAGANVISAGVFTATNNTAARSGGAIYAYQSTSSTMAFAGGSKFVDNRAGVLGGAIVWQHTADSVLNFNANTGDIVFQGNTANGVRNAMYIDPSLNKTSTINVTASSGKTVAFYDPITTGTNAGTKFVLNISGQGGSLLFDTYTSPIAALTTVNTGAALRLSNNAIFGKDTASGFLTLKTGAVLSGAGTVRTGTMAIENNALLEARNGGTLKIEAGSITTPAALRLGGNGAIDLGTGVTATSVTVGVTSVAMANTAQTLTLASNTPLTLANGGMINIDLFANGTNDLLTLDKLTLAGTGAINLAGSGSGAFKIVTAANTDLSTLGLVRLVNGSAPTARVTADLRYENSGHELWVDFASRNLVTTWTGSNGRTWKSSTDIADANWNDTGATDKTFEFGDSVNFANAGAGTVTIAETGVVAADMTVDATADYTFAGAGGITTDQNSSFGITSPITGKLTKKNTGALNFTNTGVNTFTNGIDIAGGVVSFTSADQITTTGTSISFIGTGTLRAAAADLSIDNTLDVAAAASGAIDVLKDNTLTHTGTLRGGATATLNKTGAGSLVISNNNGASFTGTTNIAAGTLSIASTGILGGKTVVQNGATLAGNGTAGAAGSVTVRPGGIIEVGMPGMLTPQVLTLNNLSVDAALLRYDLFSGNTSDRINATGAPVAVGAGASAIVITAFQTGTFNLGNLAALNGKVTVSEIGGMSPRHSGTLSVSGNDLILETTGDKSRALSWTGSSNAVWDYSSNWLESGTALQFASGDAITFDSASDTPARRTISLNTAPVRVTAITVQGNADYTFTGSNGITADPTSNILGGITNPSGKLIKSGSGTLTFANTTANNFLGGIEIAGGAIAFANSDQLGDGGNSIRFTGPGTLIPTSAESTLPNDIIINGGQTATLAIGTGNLSYTGALTAGAATATLVKSGNGTLTLDTTNNSAYTGTTNVLAGRLTLVNDASLGGTVTLANATTLAGSGTLTGTVKAGAGSTIKIGNSPGSLAIKTLTLADTSTLTGEGTLSVTNGTLTGLVTANIAAATNLSVSGTLAGTGTLNKIGAGNLIYTAASNLGYDTTIITDGFVMFRGITGLTTGTHNIQLAGGWLDLSDAPPYNPDGSTANKWSALNITGTLGGIIGANDLLSLGAGENKLTLGSIGNPGLFVVVNAGEGNTATITGSSAYVGFTRIDSGILKVTANEQLGDITANRNVILNGGNLQISGSFDTARTLEVRASGTYIADTGIDTAWSAISGSSTAILTKSGAGTLTNKGNSTIKGVNVLGGRYVALKTDGLGVGSGTSSVASGASIEFLGIGDRRVIDTNIVGSGTVMLTSSTLSVSGNNGMGSVVVANSTITVASKNAFGGLAGIVTMDANSRLSITATTSEFGRLALNGGSIIITTPSGTNFRQMSINELQGGGRIRMNVNFTNASGLAAAYTKADYLVIENGSGNYILDLSTTSSNRTSNPLSSFDLIDSGSSTVTFELPNGIFEIGTNRYHLAKGYGDPYAPDPEHWYLVYNTISNTAEAILSTASTVNIDWFLMMDSASQRLGEFRNNLSDARDHYQSPDSFKSPAIGDTWIRARGYQLEATNQYSDSSFTQYGGGVSAGMDRTFKTDNTATLIGLMIDTGLISRNFREFGSGHSYTLTGGLYATWMHRKGTYADISIAGSTYGHKFTAHTANAGNIDGEYQNTILGMNIEVGRRTQLKAGWWVDLAVQCGYANITGSNYDTTADDVGIASHVRIKEQEAWQSRGLVRIGRQHQDSRWNPYVKLGLVATGNSGGEIYADDRTFKPDYKGGRFEAGFGTTYDLGKLSQLYFDYEYAKASDYERPWSLNLGVRYLW